MRSTERFVLKKIYAINAGFWGRACEISMGTRSQKQEVMYRFRNFVEGELTDKGAYPPKHWEILNNDTDSELYEFLIQFIEYLAEW